MKLFVIETKQVYFENTYLFIWKQTKLVVHDIWTNRIIILQRHLSLFICISLRISLNAWLCSNSQHHFVSLLDWFLQETSLQATNLEDIEARAFAPVYVIRFLPNAWLIACRSASTIWLYVMLSVMSVYNKYNR